MIQLLVVLGVAALVALAAAIATRARVAAPVRDATGAPGVRVDGRYVEDVAEPSRARRPARTQARWVDVGEPVELSGRRYEGGLVYVGDPMPAVDPARGDEPACLDPRAPADRGEVDPSLDRMGYWPSYGALTAEARAAHLTWLCAGRRQPGADPGHVFLFLYGLERRALHDLAGRTEGEREFDAIAREVLELLRVYHASTSFVRYATAFLGVLSLSVDDEALQRSCALLPRIDEELPVGLRAAIGRAAARASPLDAETALCWIRHEPEIRLPTSASRVAAEFDELFRTRFLARHPQGLRLPTCKRTIRASYRPASASFGGPLVVDSGIPDVASLVGPRRRVAEIATACAEDLAEYARFVQREPARRNEVQALALLPKELASSRRTAALERLRDQLATAADGATPIDAAVLLAACAAEGDVVTRREQSRMLRGLEVLGFGVEPDLRFGGPALRARGKAVVFRSPADAPRVLLPRHAAAMLLLHLGTLVGSAASGNGEAERSAIEEQVEHFPDLTEGERARLRAHLRWLFVERPRASGLARRLAGLDAAQRDTVAGFLVRVVLADGRVDPAEVVALQRAFVALGLPQDDVHKALHDATADVDRGPVVVRDGSLHAGAAVPPRVSSEAAGLTLDMETVARRMRETAAVSSLLAQVFDAEEPEDKTPATDAPDADAPQVAGLDGAHAALLFALSARASWGRAEYEGEAERLGLLPDGALEVINDLAFERCGAAVCEGEDPLEIDMDVMRELRS
ncbi:MAG: TerB N-terminal domain-containing protein [Planctomycetota bacterium]